MIQYKSGDLFEGDERYIAHGCNARGAMNKGFAFQLRTRFPRAFEYYSFINRNDRLKLGRVYDYEENGRVILHCITQKSYGSGLQVDYDAVKMCMQEISRMFDARFDAKVAMPKIGAGLGGGNWTILEDIIEENSPTWTPVVYELE